MTASASHPSRWSLVAYASMAAPMSVVFTPVIIFLPPMYGTEVGLDLAVVGLLFLLARFWDAITDPLIGHCCDRWNFRMGRRKVWIAAAGPLLMLMTWLFFQPPDTAGAMYLVFMILLFYPAWTMVMIPYQSWGAELSTDYQVRTRIAGYREIASMIGTVTVLSIPMFLVDTTSASKREVLGVMAATFLLGFPVAAALALQFAPDRPVERSRAALSWRMVAATLRANRPFLAICLVYLCVQFGYGIYLSTIQLFIISAWGLGQYFLPLVLLKHLVSIVGVLPWVWLSRHAGKHVAYALSLVATALGLLGFSQVEEGNSVQAIAIFIYMGLVTAPILVFPPAIVADTIDYGLWRSGQQNTGLYMAILQLVNKSALALSIGLAYPLLDLAGYQEGTELSGFAGAALAGLTSYLPAAVLLIASLLALRFPLKRRHHAVIQRRLARRERATPAVAPGLSGPG